jgi:tetratricopeptide (TPR) repeat protein
MYNRLNDKVAAFEYAKKSYEFEDHEVRTDRLLALIYSDLGQKQKAIEIYRQIARNPKADAYEKHLAHERIEYLNRKN